MPTIEQAAELPPLKPVSSKSVIIEEPEKLTSESSPGIVPIDRTHSLSGSLPLKQYHTNSSRRLSGRPACDGASPSLYSVPSLSSIGSSSTLDAPETEISSGGVIPHNRIRHHDRTSHIISQVAEWLHNEKSKRATRKIRRHSGHAKLTHAAEAVKNLGDQIRSDLSRHHESHHARTNSDLSEGSFALEKLEQILSAAMQEERDGLITPTEDKKDSYPSSRKSLSKRQGSKRSLRRSSTIHSSDTEYQEPDIDVPCAEVVLDNSKTLGYSGGTASLELESLNPKKRGMKEKEAWLCFKHEIVRLTHTLRLKGWKRMPLDKSRDIDVERLSGALTNAVYVVSPPLNFSETPSIPQDSIISIAPKSSPPKLLLRIYGPQVEHLIDRESELQILRRLARKRIGPRLLGTFINGRFEQFFHAMTLAAKDLRLPETSKQIAKRMRELHDGIELLEDERDEGPFIWRNWDKWKERCEEVISYLDSRILAGRQGSTMSCEEEWKNRGLVCGVEWSVFRSAVRRYRDWLSEQYGGANGIREKLVFAHNDTQYGNLLRLNPSGESPLMLPANEHKQLVVIDFEYASANVPGLEFANHFTEWCYNYHEPKPYALNAQAYPTPEEQHRFLKAYLQHRPPIQSRPSFSPSTSCTPGPKSSISSFMLDSRAPPAQIAEEEKQRDEDLEKAIKSLHSETRMWRIANSAQWVAWGIVQAKVPGMDEALEVQKNTTAKAEDASVVQKKTTPSPSQHLDSDPLSPEMAVLAQDAKDKRPEEICAPAEEPHEDGGDDDEEFDYLGYAQERAMFFWGDILQLGIVKREDLPAELLEKVKMVKY